MKKIIAFVMAIAIVASLAAAASAMGVTHSDGSLKVWGNGDVYAGVDAWGEPVVTDGAYLWDMTGVPGQDMTGVNYRGAGAQVAAAWEVALSSQAVKGTITNCAEQKWVTCTEAITAGELMAAAEAYEDAIIKNLTVFAQRNLVVEDEEAEMELDVTLWPVGKKNATVILFKGVDEEAYTVVGYAEAKECSVVLPGSGMLVIAMAW